MKKFAIIGAVFAMLAVALGAFGAHALKEQLGSSRSVWETAVQYQMFHALALLVIAILLHLFRDSFFFDCGMVDGYRYFIFLR